MKSIKKIRKVNSIRQYLCKNSTASLVSATDLTRLDYCNSACLHGSSTKINAQLNWLTITKRCQYKLLVLTFKVLHSQTPGYISDLFNWYTPARALRSASTTSLIPNRSKTIKFGRRLVGTSSAALWNHLPDNIRKARNVIHLRSS